MTKGAQGLHDDDAVKLEEEEEKGKEEKEKEEKGKEEKEKH